MRLRLISAAAVAGWEADLRGAMTQAADRQHRSVAAALAAAGLSWDSPVGAAADLWNQADWSATLDREVAPVTGRIAADIVAALHRRVPRSRDWGLVDMVDQLAARPVDLALRLGPTVAARMTRNSVTAAGVDLEKVRAMIDAAPKRYGGVVHPEAQSTMADAYQQAYKQLNEIVSRSSSAMANEATALIGQAAQQQTAGTILHIWTTQGDDDVRPDHEDADSQSALAGDPFDVGGELLMYPGDPDGSMEQTANCRCWLETLGIEAEEEPPAEAEPEAG